MNEPANRPDRESTERSRNGNLVEPSKSNCLRVCERFKWRLFTNSLVGGSLTLARHLRYLAGLQRSYFRTTDALILLVSQHGFVFLDLFHTENRSGASNVSFNFFLRIFSTPTFSPVFHNVWLVSNLLLYSVTRLAFRTFRYSRGSAVVPPGYSMILRRDGSWPSPSCRTVTTTCYE